MKGKFRQPRASGESGAPGAPGPQESTGKLSRGEFLKALSAGALAILLPPGWAGSLPDLDLLPAWIEAGEQTPLRQGRVASETIHVHARPSFSSPQVGEHRQDAILDIRAYAYGDARPAHNRVWYLLQQDAYAHSGEIQPVETRLNPPASAIPPQGRLAEVTAPFTDAFWGPGRDYPHAYRLYYATTHWVSGVEYSDSGEAWYRLADDRWDFETCAPAPHLRLVTPAELAPISADLPLAAKRLEVVRRRQVVIAYEYNRPAFIARACTGGKFSNGDFSTPRGYHITSVKRPSRHMAAGNLAYTGYDLPGVPWVTYFIENGISFHGTYWHNSFGEPRSHGCVNLSPTAAKWIYRWTQPHAPADAQEVVESYGTAVEVI